MTLRKHIGSDGRSPGHTRYSANPTSPTDPDGGVLTNANSSENPIPQSNPNNIQDGHPFVNNGEVAKADVLGISELPPLRPGSGQLSTDVSSGSRGPPLPLEVPQALATPDTSPGGWQSERSSPPRMKYNMGTNEQLPGSMKSNTSNPFRRSMEKIPVAQADVSTEASSANIWAGEANANYVHPQAWTSNAVYPHYHQPSEDRRYYSPVDNTPFTVPSMNIAAPTGPQNQPWVTPNTEGEKYMVREKSNMEENYPVQPYSAPQDSNNAAFHTPSPQFSGLQALEGSGVERGVIDVQSSETLASSNNDKSLPPLPPREGDIGPPLPPRATSHQPASSVPCPPLPRVDTSVGTKESTSGQVQPRINGIQGRNQRSETYQIRLVNWYDASSSVNPRRSPIMVQNANGPCPLLALVNALTLSTPAGISTALIDTLENREQVSLGLLLDAVIDELMSGRRGNAAQNLPDVSELYAFLVNLHTGMNVNPRFIPSESQQPHLLDAPIQESPYESMSSTRFTGVFEDTTEMKLYSTFAVPLIHGWIPSRTHPAFAALGRSAKTYEDAQNLLFAEEELEDKLQRQGLDTSEQLLLEDIGSIKHFLSSSATQLTGYGLDSITEALDPGQIVILFRNDHFSTLYRHPRSGGLFCLVTDMGYAGHDEVVWESLVDVSGEGSEFFAGDFRVVGNNQSASSHAASGAADGWTTVPRSQRSSRFSRQPSRDTSGKFGTSIQQSTVTGFSNLSLQGEDSNPKSPNTEQEDHDLALALQLQEEEEERERQDVAARKRENELSQAFLETQPSTKGRSGAKKGSDSRSNVPTKANTRGGSRSSQIAGVNATPRRVPPARSEEADEAPPPSYEQAANGPAYNPPPGHPTYSNASNGAVRNTSRPQGRQRHSSAYTETSSALANSPITSSPVSPSYSQPPTLSAQSRRQCSGNRPMPPRGGLGGVEGAPGLYRRNGNPSLTADQTDRNKGDCLVM